MRKIKALELMMDTQNSAISRAVSMWRKQHPDDNVVFPDTCSLVEWLIDTMISWRNCCNKYRKRLDEGKICTLLNADIKDKIERQVLLSFGFMENGAEPIGEL